MTDNVVMPRSRWSVAPYFIVDDVVAAMPGRFFEVLCCRCAPDKHQDLWLETVAEGNVPISFEAASQGPLPGDLYDVARAVSLVPNFKILCPAFRIAQSDCRKRGSMLSSYGYIAGSEARVRVNFSFAIFQLPSSFLYSHSFLPWTH